MQVRGKGKTQSGETEIGKGKNRDEKEEIKMRLAKAAERDSRIRQMDEQDKIAMAYHLPTNPTYHM